MLVDVPAWSTMDNSLTRLAQKCVDREIGRKLQVRFFLLDFPMEAKEVAEKLEPDGFLASFRQKGVVTVEKYGTVITLSGS